MQIIPQHLIVTGQTLFIASTMGMGGLVGAAGGGWFMEIYSPQSAYYLGGTITLFGVLLAIVGYVKMSKIKDEYQRAQAVD